MQEAENDIERVRCESDMCTEPSDMELDIRTSPENCTLTKTRGKRIRVRLFDDDDDDDLVQPPVKKNKSMNRLSDLPMPPHVSPPLKLTLPRHAIEMSLPYRPAATQNVSIRPTQEENTSNCISHTIPSPDHTDLPNQPTSRSPRSSTTDKSHSVMSHTTPSPGHTDLPNQATRRSPRSRTTDKSHSVMSHTTPSLGHSDLPNQATSRSYSSPRGRVREQLHRSVSHAASLPGRDLPAPANNRSYTSPRSRTTDKSHSVMSHTTPSPGHTDLPNQATCRIYSSPRSCLTEKSRGVISCARSPPDCTERLVAPTNRNVRNARNHARDQSNRSVSHNTLSQDHTLPTSLANQSCTNPRGHVREKSHSLITNSAPSHTDLPMSPSNPIFRSPENVVREKSNDSISHNASSQDHTLSASATNRSYACARGRDNENSDRPISHATLSPGHCDQLTSGASQVTDNLHTSSLSLNYNAASCATVSSVVSAVDRKMLILLEEIRLNSRTTISLLQQFLAHKVNEDRGEGDLRDRLPVCSLEELELLNTDSKSIEFRGRLVRYLGIVGGSEHAETTRAVLSRLMTNGVAKSLNWVGNGGKTAFGKMNLSSIVYDAVRRNPQTCRATDKDVAETTKVWLKHADDRLGGRSKRQTSCTRH